MKIIRFGNQWRESCPFGLLEWFVVTPAEETPHDSHGMLPPLQSFGYGTFVLIGAGGSAMASVKTEVVPWPMALSTR